MGYIPDWTPMSGALASNDMVLVLDVSDKTDSAEGTNKLLEGDYVVQDPSAAGATVTNGGNIQLDGNTLTVVASGSLDLNTNTLDIGGNLTTDGALTIAGAVITFGGHSLTISGTGSLVLGTNTFTVSSPATLDLNSNTLALTTGNLSFVAPALGATITLSDDGTLDLGGNTLTLSSGAILDLGGFTLTADGNVTFTGTSVTVGGNTYDLDMLGAPGVDNRLAVWSSSKLVEADIAQTGGGVLTLSAATPQTLEVLTGGTLDLNGTTLDIATSGVLNLNNQQLTLTGTGTLDLGISRTLAVKDGNITLRGGGGELQLAGKTLAVTTGNVTLVGGAVSGGTLTLGDNGLTVSGGSPSITGGGTLALAGFTATVAKTGTVAMTDDVDTHWAAANGAFGPYFNLYSNPDNGHNSTSWIDYDAGFIWLGATYGSQAAKLAFGGRLTGAGTGKIRVTARSDGLVKATLDIPNNSNNYQVVTTDFTLPASNDSYIFELQVSSSSTYMWVTASAVICA